MNPSESAVVTLAASILLVSFFLIVVSIGGAIAAYWRLFTKAGHPGWAVLVPVYNTIIASRISRTPSWFGALTGITVCASVWTYSLSDPTYYQVNYLIALAFEIILLVLMARQYKASHPIWFWLGVFLAPYIAVFFVGRVEYKKIPPVLDRGQKTVPAEG